MTETKEFIEKTLNALDSRDALKLREISVAASSEAAIEGHRELMLIALVDYALSKILSKVHYQSVDDNFYRKIRRHLDKALHGSKQDELRHLEAIEDMVIKLDEAEGNYEQNLIEKAQVKKASKLYEQGFSLKRAAEMTGANPTDVLDYIGGSKIHEFKGVGRNAKRLKVARGVFK
jgi:hypothetical protein